MQIQILEQISFFHEIAIAPTAREIFDNQNFKIDFTTFNAYLAQMVKEGLLFEQNNKYALPGHSHLIDETWHRDLEVQYFTNQFRAINQILKFIPFIKGVGISRNSFFRGSNEVFLNFVVEPGTVHTTYYIAKILLKLFNKFSIFDAKVQFIIPLNDIIDLKTAEGFFANVTYTVFGNYQFNKDSVKPSILSKLVKLLLENSFKGRLETKRHYFGFKNLFCNIEDHIKRIRDRQKIQSLLNV